MAGQHYFFLDFETTGLEEFRNYPIQIGYVVTNEEFEIIESFESFIEYPEILLQLQENAPWPDLWAPAMAVNKITESEYLNGSRITPTELAKKLKELTTRYFNPSIKIGKPIIISDNIIFENMWLKRLNRQSTTKFIKGFHYSLWDFNFACKILEIEKPRGNAKKHRALDDALMLVDIAKKLKEKASKIV